MKKENYKKALAYAIKQGADQCEIYFGANRGFSLKIRENTIDTYEKQEETGYSVRLLRNGAPGFSYGVDPSLPAIKKAVDDALAVALFLEPEPDRFFNAPGLSYPALDLVDQRLEETPFAEKVALAKEIYAQAQGKEKIGKVENTSYGESIEHIYLINSLGLEISYERSQCYASAAVIAAEGGESETGGAYRLSRFYRDMDSRAIAEEAVQDGREKLGAKKIVSGDYPVILHPKTFLDLFSILMPSFLGDRVWKGKSLLETKERAKIAPQFLTLYSDGFWESGVATSPFDDEGSPTRKIKLLDGGTVTGFLYDNQYGKRVGKGSTGNAYGSFKGWPGISFNNFYFLPGEVPLAEMIASHEKAVYIKSLMGLHTANALTGDFSLGVKGHFIENGEIAYPIAGVAVAGNLLTLLEDIVTISRETESYGRKSAPYVEIGELRISGK